MKVPRSFFAIFIFLTASCAVAPAESEIREAVADYFEAEHYRLIDMKIERVEDIPLSKKTYMGAAGYIADVRSITLEALKDKGSGIRRGDRMTFSGAKILVKKGPGDKGPWRVSVISGIPVD